MRYPAFLAAAVALAFAGVARAGEVKLVSDVAYLEAGRSEKLDLYLPVDAPGSTALRPAVVYFHGGGWYKGDKATGRETNIGDNLAAAGYVFVSANYKLGKSVWPQNIFDCKNAVRFVRAHAAEYRIDPNRIAVMGTSAGGHLALLVAYSPDDASLSPAAPYPGVSDRVRGVIDFYGITNLASRQNVTAEGEPTGKLDDAHSEEMLGRGRVEGAAVWKAASPVTHIRPNSPPTLIVHGLYDKIVDYPQAVELANVLRANGVKHQMLLIEGVGHMFDLTTWEDKPLPIDLRPVVLKFLGQVMAPPAKSGIGAS